MVVLRWALGLITFLFELVLWAGVGRVAWRQLTAIHSILAIIGGVLAATLIIVFWSFFLSPMAKYRLSLLYRIIVISLLTIVTGYLLYRNQDKNWGLLLMIPGTILQALGQYVMDDM